jgi:fatty acid desaturase
MKKEKHEFDLEIKYQLSKLTGKDNWHSLLALLEDISIIIAVTFLTNFAGGTCFLWMFWYMPSLIIIGARMRGLATVLHESAHRNAAKSKNLNEILGHFSGFLILQILPSYRETHFPHHYHLGDMLKDPDLIYHLKEGLYAIQKPIAFFWRSVLSPCLLAKVPSTIEYLIQDRLSVKKERFDNPNVRNAYYYLITFWTLCFSAIYLFNLWSMFILFWVIPFLTTFPIINWFCEMAEHYPKVLHGKMDIDVSRNRLGNGLENSLFGIHAENLHLEHHLHPSIPYYNLHKAREIRLQDDTYQKVDSTMGGIFCKGKNGAPSAISQMMAFHRRRN